MEAEAPAVRVGATPSGLTTPPHPQHPHVFYRPDALPAAEPTAPKHCSNQTDRQTDKPTPVITLIPRESFRGDNNINLL